MNIVDSSGWIEYFNNGKNADFFAPLIENTQELLVPAICIYEVFKCILQQHGESMAERIVANMFQGNVIDHTAPLALSAAKISINHKIPMANSFILATARLYNATLWTEDKHFEGLEGVEYIRSQ